MEDCLCGIMFDQESAEIQTVIENPSSKNSEFSKEPYRLIEYYEDACDKTYHHRMNDT